jgi:hypothetical protein
MAQLQKLYGMYFPLTDVGNSMISLRFSNFRTGEWKFTFHIALNQRLRRALVKLTAKKSTFFKKAHQLSALTLFSHVFTTL